MADIAADLTTPHEKVQCGHPFLGAQPGLTRKVVQVRHEARHEILEPRIAALRVDQVSVLGDVVDREIQQRRSIVCRGRHGRRMR